MSILQRIAYGLIITGFLALSTVATAEDVAVEVVAAPAAVMTAQEKAAAQEKKNQQVLAGVVDENVVTTPDANESLPLPPYPKGALTSIGKMQIYVIDEEDTMLDVARHFRLGFTEVRAANQRLDPWSPSPGDEVIVPSFRLLPRAPQEGIVVNLAQMRLYYFQSGHKRPVTYPLGIGREGLATPVGQTTIVRKTANPIWYPTQRMRQEKDWLPAAVPAGPSNPLGTRALYLGWPTFLIHGSNKPWAIGRRVSSGCMRMYPEDILELYQSAPLGTKVTIVDQPVLVAWVGDALYLEANPSKTQGNDIEITGDHVVKPLDDGLRKVIIDASGIDEKEIDWRAVSKAVEERAGYPVLIGGAAPAQEESEKKPVMSTPQGPRAQHQFY